MLATMHKVAAVDGGAASTLPVPLWSVILQHVPQQQRLSQCALVSRTLSQAAAQATVHSKRSFGIRAAPTLGPWVAVHASQQLSLDLSASGNGYELESNLGTLQLPLSKLMKLQLLKLQGINISVQLPSEGSSPISSCNAGRNSSSTGSSHAAWPALVSLQQLELQYVGLADVNSLLQLTKAPQLTRLKLSNVSFPSSPTSSGVADIRDLDEVADAIPRLLHQLPQLSVLDMPDIPFRHAAVQQAAAMTQLQYMVIRPIEIEAAWGLQQLPSSLTQLQLNGDREDNRLSLPTEVPQLTGLRSLTMCGYGVPHKVLGTLTQLQTLRLYGCTFVPHTNTGTAGTAALLEALCKLTCLQDLHLEDNGLDTVNIAPQHFAALTASSGLTQLVVRQEAGACLPQGAMQHMFSPDRQMQALRQVSFSRGDDFHIGPGDWCIDSEGLLSITSSCPQLQDIDIAGSVNPEDDLSDPLLQLPQSCTSLIMGGEAISDACMHLVLKLPRLQELKCLDSPGVTDLGVEQLTALDLQSLFVYSSRLSEEMCTDSDMPGLLSLDSTPKLGSVSQQLDDLCDDNPVCIQARLREIQETPAGGSSKGRGPAQAPAAA